MMWIFLILTLLFAGCGTVIYLLRVRNVHLWLPDYLARRAKAKQQSSTQLTHIMFCFVDHYEPQWGKHVSYQQEVERVDRWYHEYPKTAGKHQDSDGVHPQHTFFYPEEEYRPEHLNKLAELCARGFGDIEVHLHHDNDTSSNLRQTLERFTEMLHDTHGAFCRDSETGKLQYAFIHGNWCLDNSRADGCLCGVNDELIVLKETGCYADFTFPSAPSETQPATVNAIYYATDDPARPKSHDKGVDVAVGKPASGDLMLLTGPVGFNWKRRKGGVFPSIENSDIRTQTPPTEERVDLWVRTGIHVEGRPEWVFIKVHTHGTQEADMDTLLGDPFDRLCSYLEHHYNDGHRYQLHYVTAREAYNIVKAAEAGQSGNPNQYRDFVIPRPAYKHT